MIGMIGQIHRIVPMHNTRKKLVGWRCIWCTAEWRQLPSIHDRYGCSRVDEIGVSA